MPIDRIVAGLGLFAGLFVLCAFVADLICWGGSLLRERLCGWTKDEDGTTTVEYALMLAVMAISMTSVLVALHHSLTAGVQSGAAAMDHTADSGGGGYMYRSWP
jgi:Flp pilus assembly pilin Flp